MKHHRSLKRPVSPALILGGAAVLSFGAPVVFPDAAPTAIAQPAISVFINEQPLQFGAARPARIGGRVLVPMRSIFEALGAQVQWDAPTQSINAQRGATVVQMQIGNRNATINGQAVRLDQPPLLYSGSTMVPLRFVGEALGAEVRWSELQNAVFITDTQANQPGTLPGFPVTPNPTPVPTAVPTPLPPVTVVPPGTQPGTVPVGPGYQPPLSVPQNNAVNGFVAKVDATPPATLTLRARDTSGDNRLVAYNVAQDARVSRSIALVPQAGSAPNWGQPNRISLAALIPGEEVTTQLGPGNYVTEIAATTLFVPTRVLSVTGNRIVLNDGRNTTLTIGDTAQGGVRFLGANGRTLAAPDVRAGDTVVLYVTPSTMTIFQISSRAADITVTGGQPNLPTGPTYQPPDGSGGLVPGTQPGTQPDLYPGTNPGTQPGTQPGTVPPGAPQIQSVTHTATQPLRAGQNVQIIVRANTGLRGTVTVPLSKVPNLPLQERADRPGIYSATYAVRPGDDVLNGRITATMIGQNNAQDVQQSQTPITIDTVAPRVTGVFPANGSQTNNTMPNIAIYADDIGGSGIARGTIQLTGAGNQVIDVPAVVVVGGIAGETPRALPSGITNLRGSVVDAAGNATPVISTFTVVGGTAGAGATAVTHNARTALRTGEVLVVETRGEPNARATFDLVGDNNRLVAVNVPMREIEPGRYQGTYTVQGNENTARMRVVGRVTGFNNQPVTNEATTQVSLATVAAQPTSLTITNPAPGAQVTSPLTVRGRAVPGAIVDVTIRAEGTQITRLLIFESRRPYTQDLGTQQVQADANGNWATRPIEMPAVRDVEDLKYTITATQTDALNRRSQPVTVTVTPR